jgi:GNAT superfamily N-acetyltransferase
MQIKAVTDRITEQEFYQLPTLIYANNHNYIPHLIQDVKKVFDPKKNKLFVKGHCKRWILQKDGKTIGRIAAFVNPKTAKKQKQPTGGLGFFECIDNQEAAFKLFDTAIDYLKDLGMEAVDGPVNFGERNMFWGLLVKNFTDMNSYGMNYNPAYYQKFFEAYGFEIFFKQHCFKRDMSPTSDFFKNRSDRALNNPELKISFSDVKGWSTERLAQSFLTVYNNAWAGFPGFKTMDYRQALKTVKALKPVIDPRVVFFGFDKDKPIAFFINIPELNEIFQFVNGNLNWIGKLKFLYHKWKKTPKTLVGVVFGVDKAYHKKGVESALIKYAEEVIVVPKLYQQVILTWIGDFNPKMIKIATELGAEEYRRLHTYRYLFNRNIPFEREKIVG